MPDLSSWIVAVPASILLLVLRHPLDSLTDPRVFPIAENYQSPDHVPRQTRLFFHPHLLLPVARTGEGPVIHLVKAQEPLACCLDLWLLRHSHLPQKG